MLEMDVLDKEFKEKMAIATVIIKHLNPKSPGSLVTFNLETSISLGGDGTGIGAYLDPGKSMKIALWFSKQTKSQL